MKLGRALSLLRNDKKKIPFSFHKDSTRNISQLKLVSLGSHAHTLLIHALFSVLAWSNGKARSREIEKRAERGRVQCHWV